MEDTASVITAIAAVGWPLVLAFLIWKLLPILQSRLSAGDVTVKMFGVEVSLQDASENFGKQLADLQEKVAQLRLVAEQTHPHSLDTTSSNSAPARNEAILWVDDNPANNAFEVARLRQAGIVVHQVLSTDEALASLTHNRYTTVITDVERQENGQTLPQAGIELLNRMRENDIFTPVYVYCSKTAVKVYGDKVRAAGAAGITSSPVELFEQLHMPALD